jgi:hypothetical protein
MEGDRLLPLSVGLRSTFVTKGKPHENLASKAFGSGMGPSRGRAGGWAVALPADVLGDGG